MSTFQIFTEGEISALRKGGAVLRGCLEHVAALVRPGVKTAELDRAAEEYIRSFDGAAPAFKGYQNFPATLCTSVNDQCVHGLPGPCVLQEGDIVALDCGVLYGELYTDACITVPVGAIPPPVRQFLSVTEEALVKTTALVAPGVRIGDLSALIQQTVEEAGYSCVHSLTGHGLGSTLHQFPDIPNNGEAGAGPVLPPHTIIAIEPITAMGGGAIREKGDGWTIATADSSLSAHFEHTILVTQNGHEILA